MKKAPDATPQTPKPQVGSGGVVTPLHKTQQRKSSTDSDSRSTTGSDIDVAIATNQDLLVTVREATTGSGNKVVLVLISNVRPSTCLGSTQGDHVTAYQSFLEMLISSVEGYELKEATELILKTAKAVMPKKANVFDALQAKLADEQKQGLARDERKRVTLALSKQDEQEEFINRTKQRLIADRRGIFMNCMEKLGQSFIEEINLEEAIAFARKGPSDEGEGARVKKASHGLRVISDLNEYLLKYDEANNDEQKENILNKYFDCYIKVRSKYKDGANAAFDVKKVRSISKSWDEKKHADKLQALKDLRSSVTVEKISAFMGDMFDYKFKYHRDDGIDTLNNVVAKHIIIMLNAFGQLDQISLDRIVDDFLEKQVLEKEGWSERLDVKGERCINVDDLRKGIEKHAVLAEKIMRDSVDEEYSTDQAIISPSVALK